MKRSRFAILAILTALGCGNRALSFPGDEPATGAGGAGAGSPASGSAASPASSGGPGGAAGAQRSGDGAGAGAGGAVGATDGLPISDDELARRLAAFLWAAPADGGLVTRVADAAPRTKAEVRAIATAMLHDPRARDGATVFYRQWLDLDRFATVTKNPMLFPEFTPALQQDMINEALEFALFVTFDGDGRFPTLFTASFGFLDALLAPIYGVVGVTGGERVLTPLDPAQRAGVLTLAAVLANVSNAALPPVTARGRFVFTLVDGIPGPAGPPGVPMVPPAPAETTRDWLDAQFGSAVCGACHTQMDAVGFAFLGYDALGHFSTTERGMPVDDTGALAMPLGAPALTFHGARDLATQLAGRTDARDCFALDWIALATGQNLGAADPSAQDAIGAFAASNLDIRTLIAAVTATDAFLAP
jgi:hypothetical protein